MRTNIVIDDSLMEQAFKKSGMKTKREVVEEALKMLIKIRSQEQLKSLRGKLSWEGDIDNQRKEK